MKNRKFIKIVVWVIVGAMIITTAACFGAFF